MADQDATTEASRSLAGKGSSIHEHMPPTTSEEDEAGGQLHSTTDEKDGQSQPSGEKWPSAQAPEKPASEPLARIASIGEDFSVLTVSQKRWIVTAASFASLFSPMATAIYYPSLDTIARDLHVTNSKINITITLFLVIQGIAPSFIADIADRQGRRPMYILCFIIFSVANLGLALQNNYAALLVLRMLQAAGSSGTVALAQGVVGDIVTSAERGSYIAFASLGGMLGPMLAPVLGGIIGQYAGWHWIFWFLMILSAVVFIPLILFMPETCRNVVDNGSIPPPFLSRNITDSVRHRHRAQQSLGINEAKQAEIARKYKFRLPNPLSTLKVLFDPESAILLVATGIGMGLYYAISTGASVAFSKIYGFNQLKTGLVFIPIGAGSMLSALTTGRLVDWNFRRWCKKLNIPIIKNRRQDLTNFPIERARLEIAFPMFFIASAVIIVYGWILTINVSIAAPVVLFFFAGWGLTSTFQILNVLMIDIFPGRPSTATAANNLVRCEIGAVFSAVLLPLQEAIGWGWTYTLLTLLYVGWVPMLLFVMRRGPRWRKERKVKEDKAKADRQERRDVKDAANRRQ